MRPHIEIHDHGTGPYLLMVHGFLSSRVQWALNLEALTAFCRPVVLELWGHGRSPTPDDPSFYTIDGYIRIFESIRADLGVDTWYICGQSFGAGLTLNYALAHPDKLRGQIFTNSISALSPRNSESAAAAAMRRQADRIAAEGLAAVRALPFHPRFAKRFPPHVYAEMNADADRMNPHAVLYSIRETFPGLNVTGRFAETRIPTTLVNGKWERNFQPLREAALTLLPSLHVVDLDGGHSINIEAPEGFNTAVREMIESS